MYSQKLFYNNEYKSRFDVKQNQFSQKYSVFFDANKVIRSKTRLDLSTLEYLISLNKHQIK